MEHQDLLLEHVIEIKERLASIEAISMSMKEVLRDNTDSLKSTNNEVDEIKQDIVAVKTSIRIFKWAVPIAVAVGAGVVKAFKG